jgi:hypothetical protein
MNFLILPHGELKLNAVMDAADQEIAGRFVDELKSLGVLLPAEGEILANCPLFCVDKPGQPGQKRCIADCKQGGQNACIGKDPVFLVRNESILPQLYHGGYSAIADASKQFHNFPTYPGERRYLGCIHPIAQEQLCYAGLPMGTAQSPAVACRINNGALRQLREECSLFHGTVLENTWRSKMDGVQYDPTFGHGRVTIGADGQPVALIWAMVDDYLIHAPTFLKCCAAFSAFMDFMVWLGFICQKVKTKPPNQVQKFCGMLLDTTAAPRIRIPEEKLSRSLATIDFVLEMNRRGQLSRLTATVCGGLLQSLVEATPGRQGQTCLRSMYDDVHALADSTGRTIYYSMIQLSQSTQDDLHWWLEFLDLNPGSPSRTESMGSLTVTWGDGSGTGTGGTSETLQDTQGRALPTQIDTWMGVWTPEVQHFDSNWRELRTLLYTLQRHERNRTNLRGSTLFYFTDNLVTYYVVQNGSSSSPALHNLVRQIKQCELRLHCRIEAIHVPGKLMIIQGTDGLSRGLWISPDRLLRSSVEESRLTLEGVPFKEGWGPFILNLVGLKPSHKFTHHTGTSAWTWQSIHKRISIWTPTPELARQSICHFMDYWVEDACNTAGIFLIPRVLQRDWGYLSRHILEIGTYLPQALPNTLRYESLIPFVLLFIPFFIRRLEPNRLELSSTPKGHGRWHERQAEHVRGLSRALH